MKQTACTELQAPSFEQAYKKNCRVKCLWTLNPPYTWSIGVRTQHKKL